MFQTNFVEKIKTHFVGFFWGGGGWLENRAIYEIMWKNIVEWDRPQMTMRRMRIACWIPKTRNTHSEYVILLLFHCSNCCTNVPLWYVTRLVLIRSIHFTELEKSDSWKVTILSARIVSQSSTEGCTVSDACW